MVTVCECNLGCAEVGVSRAALREDLRVKVESGARAGEILRVTEVTDAEGMRVFALSDRAPNAPCSRPVDRANRIAYVCPLDKAGPVPARACARCEE